MEKHEVLDAGLNVREDGKTAGQYMPVWSLLFVNLPLLILGWLVCDVLLHLPEVFHLPLNFLAVFNGLFAIIFALDKKPGLVRAFVINFIILLVIVGITWLLMPWTQPMAIG